MSEPLSHGCLRWRGSTICRALAVFQARYGGAAERLAREPMSRWLRMAGRTGTTPRDEKQRSSATTARWTGFWKTSARLGRCRIFPAHSFPCSCRPGPLADASARGQEIGLTGLSTFGTASSSDPHWVNMHLDIFEWRPVRRPLKATEAYSILTAEVEGRLAGDSAPVGIMTHHLVHEEASWSFLDELLGLIADHPAVEWPSHTALFGLAQQPGYSRSAERRTSTRSA